MPNYVAQPDGKGDQVRVVGYVRESLDPQAGESAFAQFERVRRWVTDSGHQLLSVCQDARQPGRPLGWDGYRGLLAIIASGQVDAVILPELVVLSPDKVIQEVMVWDLRSRGVAVLSTSDEDVTVLSQDAAEPARVFIRDVLARVGDHQDQTAHLSAPELEQRAPGTGTDVVVHLIHGDEDEHAPGAESDPHPAVDSGNGQSNGPVT
ncbi:MAG: recombinase family protein [Acidimicrobiia bacterium]